MMAAFRATALALVLSAASTQAQPVAPARGPAIDDLLNLKRVGAPAISPDGTLVAYTVRETNWDENAYETEIWVGDAHEHAAADQREEIEPAAGVVAGRPVAGVHLRSRRQAPDLSHRRRRRRSRAPDERRRRA